MKKTYLKPDTTLVQLDTCSICASSPTTFVWDVDKAYKEGDEEETSDWGPIKFDQGEGKMDDYDPWNSSNW